ncbi:MAG: beta-galactosidase trimerization domain-containing protein [Acidobacteriaceae bacterium]|nr:beta-galactosidase trimerization domain-containing protein [Acidobacteriaceae bacterium]
MSSPGNRPSAYEVLATYTVGAYTGKVAITTHTFGKGKSIYLGANLDPPQLARALLMLMARAASRVLFNRRMESR